MKLETIILFSVIGILSSCSNQMQQEAQDALHDTAIRYNLEIEFVDEVDPYTAADSVKRLIEDMQQEIFDLRHERYSDDSAGTAKFVRSNFRRTRIEEKRDSIVRQLSYFDSSKVRGYWTSVVMKGSDNSTYTARAYFNDNMHLKALEWFY